MSIRLRKNWNVNLGFPHCLNQTRPNSFPCSEIIIIFECADLGTNKKTIENNSNFTAGVLSSKTQKDLVLPSWKGQGSIRSRRKSRIWLRDDRSRRINNACGF
ncbi:hypothetical protein LINPERHAP2_LOCUS21055 [Linum perenne]